MIRKTHYLSLTLSLALLSLSQVTTTHAKTATAVFAGGCFWCMEKPFDRLSGVTDTKSGYAGGKSSTATYKKVSSGNTRHIEAIQVTYDTTKISYETLLKTYWVNVDPFDNGGQFCDRGYQYTAAVFPKNSNERAAAKASKAEFEKKVGRKFVTKITGYKSFYPAEAYHQNYYKRNPIRYNYYRTSCGRDNRLKAVWGKLAKH